MRTFLIIAVFYLAGLAALSFGISLIITAGLGAGPWDAFFVGLSESIGLTVGSWTFIGGFVLILINAMLLKQKPDFSALITMFLIGSFIDFWMLIVLADAVPASFVQQAVILTAGILCCGAGIASYLQSSFARNPIDHAMIVFHTLTGKSLAFSKTALELMILVAAFFIGGPIGIGTLIIAFLIGPLIQVFHRPVTAFRTKLTA
ncbi:YczE/YyaS/YitT family protein [Alkalicoccus luteus]|uniref:Membrane protein n=1 Tax=Alkalicoccus luteus TaxID=1237094 RepID=A0A969PS14_9BACI|nr:membrane protein [Alkalicoccus luteus]NJP39386.1 membrane protein [Alkalicoccus luteus]